LKTLNSIDEARLAEEVEIIEAAKSDLAQFRPLYEKHFKRIFLFVYHRVEDRALASDITSQIFLKAMQRIHQFNFHGLPISSWLYRIAINECTDYFRRSKRSRVVYVEDVSFHNLFEEMFPEDPQSQLEKGLQTVLQQLKPGELQIIELRYFEDMPFKMVAEVLNISEINAKVRTYRTLGKMKRLFLKLL
jgi:RNA polymerase sigma-70 factor (ECF subfamily)